MSREDVDNRFLLCHPLRKVPNICGCAAEIAHSSNPRMQGLEIMPFEKAEITPQNKYRLLLQVISCLFNQPLCHVYKRSIIQRLFSR